MTAENPLHPRGVDRMKDPTAELAAGLVDLGMDPKEAADYAEEHRGPQADRELEALPKMGFRPVALSPKTIMAMFRTMTKDARHEFMAQTVISSIRREVKELRLSRDLTQAQFAERCGMTQSGVARLEDGRGRVSPSISTLLRIAVAMDVALVIQFIGWPEWAQQYGTIWVTPRGFFTASLSPLNM